MSSRARLIRFHSLCLKAARTFFAAGLQSLIVILAALLAFPPAQALAQQQSVETTTFVPLPGSTFNILNPPAEPVTLTPQIFSFTPPSTPITVTPIAGTTLVNSGITLTSSSLIVTQNTQNCLTAPDSTNCASFIKTTESAVSVLTNPANAPSGCQFANNPGQIVQCMNYNGGKYQAPFPATWEASSIAAYMMAHGRPAADAQYIFQYGRSDLRNDVRGWMAAQILGIIRKVANNIALTADEQSVYTWMQTMLFAMHAQAAQIAENEYQKWQANPCDYVPNQTIQNALGIDLTSGSYCGASNFQNLFTQASYPPAAYFQTFGHSQVFEGQLGVAGVTALVNTELSVTRVPSLVGQNPPAAQLQYLALLAAPAAAPAGTIASVDAAYNAIFPYRSVPLYKGGQIPRPQFQETSYNYETEEPATVGESGSVTSADNPGVQAATEGVEAAGDALKDGQVGLQAVTDADEGLDFVSAASAGATVVAVILFALTAAISQGINVSQSVQNQADDAGLALSAIVLKNAALPDLTQLIQTSAGQLEVFEAFTLATLPDYPSSTPLPGYGTSAAFTGAPIEGFYSAEAAVIDTSGPNVISNQLIDYVDPLTLTVHTAALWNGFVIVDGKTFGFTLPFTDQTLIRRVATRIGTNLFEVEPATYDPNAPYCQGDLTTGVTTSLPAGATNIIQCGSAVLEALRMWVGAAPASFHAADIYITGAPVLTDKPQIGAIINQTKPISFSPAPVSTPNDPLGQIPCDAPAIVAGSPIPSEGGGTIDLPTFLPAGMAINNPHIYSGNSQYQVGSALVGTPTNPGDAGKVFPIQIISECGNNGWAGLQYNSVPFPTYGVPTVETINLVVGTNVAIDNYPIGNLTLGVPVSETLFTVSNPVAKLTATGLPPGLAFKDNGDGTGTVSGTPTAAGIFDPVFSANDIVDSASVNSKFNVIDSTPIFVTPKNNQKLTVFSGVNNDPRNTISIQTNALAPMKLALAATSATNLTFSDFGNGSGQIVFNDPSPDFSDTSLTLTATETNDAQVVTSVNFTIHANPGPPYIAGSTNGPLAFIVGMPANASNPPTVNTNSAGNTITPGYPAGYTPPPSTGVNAKTTMPAGLTFTNNANGSIAITGTPAAGTGGYYQIPITIANGGVQSLAQVNLVVYEPPSFPIYTGNHAFVFRVGTPRTTGISPVSGFPVAEFSPSDWTMGNSIGVIYALNATAPVDSFGNISGTPFNIGNALTGLGNGTFTLSYNGQPLSSGPSYTLPLVAQVETGLVPIGVTSQLYVDQAPLSAQIYVLPPGDASGDGVVNCTDYTLVKSLQGTTVNNAAYSALADLNGDGVINLQDLVLVTQNLPKGTLCH